MGKTKVGKGMKLEVVVDHSGLPLGLEVAAADISEQKLLMPALDDVPVEVPPGTPVVADKGHDSDPLRDEVEEDGYATIIPHRKNRVKPSRNDGRKLRRYRHRWRIERTNAWLHCYRGLAVRWAYYPFMYVGVVYAPLRSRRRDWCVEEGDCCSAYSMTLPISPSFKPFFSVTTRVVEMPNSLRCSSARRRISRRSAPRNSMCACLSKESNCR